MSLVHVLPTINAKEEGICEFMKAKDLDIFAISEINVNWIIEGKQNNINNIIKG